METGFEWTRIIPNDVEIIGNQGIDTSGFASVAQWIEQLPSKQFVGGSNPSRGANIRLSKASVTDCQRHQQQITKCIGNRFPEAPITGHGAGPGLRERFSNGDGSRPVPTRTPLRIARAVRAASGPARCGALIRSSSS